MAPHIDDISALPPQDYFDFALIGRHCRYYAIDALTLPSASALDIITLRECLAARVITIAAAAYCHDASVC